MRLKSVFLVSFAGAGLFFGNTAMAVNVGWQKLIDEPFSYHETAYNNYNNCQKIDSDCGGAAVDTVGRCGSQPVTTEFYCAGPWRSYEGLWGTNHAYLFLSKYGANMPHVALKERRGWAMWQWEVETSGIYQVEVFYRPTENRTPDANYTILSLKSLGNMTGKKEISQKTIDQRTHYGPLDSQGWVTLGEAAYRRGSVAAVLLDATDDEYSDEADAVRWTLKEIMPDSTGTGANHLLLKR